MKTNDLATRPTASENKHSCFMVSTNPVAVKWFYKITKETETAIQNYVPKKLTEIPVKRVVQPLYTSLGESYLPSREEFEFVTGEGTATPKYVPRIALAIARNRSTPTRTVYYTQLDELGDAYKRMGRNPWVLNRILRIMERGFLKPNTPELKQDYLTEDFLYLYLQPNRWQSLAKTITSTESSYKNRTLLVRSMTEQDWLNNLFPRLKNRVFVRDIVLLTEDDALNTTTPAVPGTAVSIVPPRYPQKPKLWGKQVPVYKPHVEVVEEYLKDSDITSPKVHIYEDMNDSGRDLFYFFKSSMPKWRNPTETGFFMENFFEEERQEREQDRNMRRRYTPLTQLGEVIEEETTEDLEELDTSEENFSESEEEVEPLEAFEYLENPLTPMQLFRWGALEPGSDKEFIELCQTIEKDRQSVIEDGLDDGDDVLNQEDSPSLQDAGTDDVLEDDDLLDLSEDEEVSEGGEEEDSMQLDTASSTDVESSRISSKTRRYFASPRSKSDSSYHQTQGMCPPMMEYSLSYFLSRWPKSTTTSLDTWVTEVRRILAKCDGVLGQIEKEEFQLVAGLVDAIQQEINQNIQLSAVSVKDGRALDLTKAYTKNIMLRGKGSTAESITQQSSEFLATAKKRAFPDLVLDDTLRKALPVLDVKKVFTGGGTRKHSVVNHITEKRAGFNTIRWVMESALKNPRNTRLRAVSAFSKEIAQMSRPGKVSFAQQQRAKIYAEIWSLMGKPEQSEDKKGSQEDGKHGRMFNKKTVR